ncbi:MAG TPA: efflux RND transporter periplasmic adaptor subunit [Thermoleophilia bacterium]|nr:efflux RND transporter periplasmic adaptor subunit [Thermoleophilia bacterium]
MTSSRRRLLAILAGLLVVAGVVTVSVVRDNRSKVVVQTQKVGRRDLTSIVEASGEVKPKRYVNVSANVSGPITHLLVKEGDAVKRGQVLATIDATRFAADTRQSEAALAASRADLDRELADLEVSRLNFERNQRMRNEALVSEQVYDQAQAEYKAKQAQVESQKRRIAQLEAALASNVDTLQKATLPAPMDGVVTSLKMEEGESVIGAQSFQPTVIMTVADLSVMEVEIMVDETDIRNVKLGQEAEVRVDALEGVKIKGEVTEIGASALVRGSGSQTAAQTTLGANTGNQPKDFKVKITVLNPPPNLRPGLNATADITTSKREKVVAVPVQAVVVREVGKDGKVVDPDSGPGQEGERQGNTVSTVARVKGEEKDGVFLVQGEKAVFTPVKTGIMGETEIEVTQGVSDGQEIVTGSYRTLRTLKDQARLKVEAKGKKS